ncbi:MAG: ATP-binding protein [Patescibacteria group bacterium]
MFQSARLKLTGWYLLIIMLICVLFSFIIYRVLCLEVERFARMQQFRIERSFENEFFRDEGIVLQAPPVVVVDRDLIREVKARIVTILAILNGAILLITGILGYFLAGKTLSPIQKMVDEQNRFVTDASHELRTPLTSLKSAMEVSLRDKQLSLQDARILIADNITEVNKLQKLSDNLLQLTQYDNTDSKPRQDKVGFRKVINHAIKKVEPLAQKKHIDLINQLIDIHVCGSSDALEDLFVILLDNAIKYSRDKGQVHVSVSQKKGYAVSVVKDHGIGIAKKDLPFIFDRFYRADSARLKTGEGGFGLGLSIAKRIVEEHQGTITAKSIIGKGTEIVVKIPVVK